MKTRYVLVVLSGLLFPHMSFTQVSPEPTGVIESLLESVEAQGGGTADFEQVLEDLEALRRKPLNLNTATEKELQQLPFLTDFQIRSLLDYRKERGNLLTIFELPMIYGFSDELVGRILPYVTVDSGENALLPPGTLRHGNHTAILRTQRSAPLPEGYARADSGGYPGNPWLYSVRYEFDASDRVGAGFTLEKDPGEPFFRGSNRQGFDFMSAWAQYNGTGRLMTVVAGDYRLQFGQGLTLWSGSAPGKSALAVNVVKRSDAIRPYTASDENNFFRGAAAQFGYRRVTAFVFGSVKERDGNLTDTLTDGTVCFSAFQESGYHRTASELIDENAVRESMIGGNVQVRSSRLKAGVTVAHYSLNRYWNPGDDLKDVNAFTGQELTNAGIDYTASLGKIQLFGETATGNGRVATLNGLVYHAGKYASLSLLYRNYPSGFFGMHTSAFSEGSNDNNENGIYAGAVLHPLPHFQVSAYADYFRFPWLRYRVDAPSSGNDFLVQVDYGKGKTSCFMRFRSENNPVNDETGTPLTEVTSRNRNGLRAHVSVKINDWLTVQDRVEAAWVTTGGGSPERGLMGYQDLSYHPLHLPLTLDFRLAWFNTGSYDSRIYAYEKDMSSGFSFSPLYSKGIRTYGMVRWDINDHFTLRFRVSHSRFSDKSVIGTGLDEIQGSGKTEFKLQANVRFF
jgi:hypothetical protein